MSAGLLLALVADATEDERRSVAELLRPHLEQLEQRHPDDVLTTAQAAAYMQVDPSRLYVLRRRGALVAEQDGRNLRWRRGELNRYLSEGPRM